MNIKISEFYNLIRDDGGTYEILTPTGYKNIGNLYKKNNKQIYSIFLENNLNLKGSQDHLVKILTYNIPDNEINSNIEILDNDTWIRLGNINIGDIIQTKNNSSKVIKIIKENISTTYDLEVLDIEHKYYSNDIVSHNTGKSAIAEGLALRIIQRRVSRVLFNKRVITLDIASMVAGTKYRGQFEERIKALMAELEKNPDIILFIDEIHTIIGAGGASGSLDASNMFKPALARGEIQIIGATTLDEYKKYIERDGALERRFQRVIVEPTSEAETLEILKNIKDKYESHHNVTYTDEALKACVTLSSRYIMDRFLPDKAIDALDESGSRVHISNIFVPDEIVNIEQKILDVKHQKNEVVKTQKYEEAAKLRDVEKQLQSNLEESRKRWEEEQKNYRQIVNEDSVAEVVSMMAGIPLQKVNQKENMKLANMDSDIKSKVIGQDEAVDKVVKAIKRGRIGLKDPNKPLGTFIFIGQSGVGKCIDKNSKVQIKNKISGKTEEIDIKSFIYNLTNTNSSDKM